ncbi:hypothetical protein PIB30_043321 [Stylosanthes scabra]|uniref:Uncharacterized protein n=1 Tax=Stylosanthes scabra TaxID=79078 RepID=A0ABU6SGT0_9FABA|nr:hypothetical protein [Stylosanthes scabra]
MVYWDMHRSHGNPKIVDDDPTGLPNEREREHGSFDPPPLTSAADASPSPFSSHHRLRHSIYLLLFKVAVRFASSVAAAHPSSIFRSSRRSSPPFSSGPPVLVRRSLLSPKPRVHDDPLNAPVDGPTQWPLCRLEEFLEELVAIAEGGSYQQRILTEYLKGVETRAEDIVKTDCGGFGESLHTGGSITSSQHQVNLAKSLGRPPTHLELFERTHKHKDETWVDKRSEQFNDKLKNTQEELTQKATEDGSSVPDELDLWCDIAGVKKGRIYGLGIESTVIDKRSSCRGSGSHSSEWLRRSEHEVLVKKLQEENNCLKTRLEKTEKAVEINNQLVQEMMKRMNFQIPIPQVGETNAREEEDNDSGDFGEE